VWGDESPAEVMPRGRVHSGYAGGPIDTPSLRTIAEETGHSL
jgi:hypothetical protein